ISFSPGATLRIVSPDSVTIFSTGAVAGCVPPPATGLVVGASCAHRAVPIRATSASAVAAAALAWRKREFMARSSSLARIDRPRHVQQLRADDNAAARAWVVPFLIRDCGHPSPTRLPGLPDRKLHARPLLTLRGCQLPPEMYNDPSLEVPVSKTLRDWLAEGEQLYSAAMQEYQSIEAQLDELEVKLAAKKSELNQIAQVIGKPPVEGNRRLTAQLIEPNSVPNSPATIARALSGRGLGR